MSIIINKKAGSLKTRKKLATRQRGHVMPRMPEISLDGPGWLRSANVLALFGISHSTLYERLRTGEFPKPDGRDGGRNYWRTETIRKLLSA